MEDIIEQLRQIALEKAHMSGEDNYIIRGLWRLELLFSPDLHINPGLSTRTIHYTLALVKILGQGCCYCYPDDNVLVSNMIGQDARTIRPVSRHIDIAMLDALFATHSTTPTHVFPLDGYGVDKAVQRAEIVAHEVLQQARNVYQRRPKVVNVGVVANFIKALLRHGLEVTATDLEGTLVGTSVSGVEVEHGERTLHLVAESDVALVTGMTLATHSLEQIIATAKQSGTRLVLFAETGANFAEVYCKIFGVDAVVSELFPFYIFQGQSIIKVYRREAY